MNCPICKKSPQTKEIFTKFNHTDYEHSFCSNCGISFDSNVNQILENYSDLNDEVITILDEKEYRKYFIETSDITDGTDNIYTSFNWDNYMLSINMPPEFLCANL